MAINDQNRARKVYSFYRPQPVPGLFQTSAAAAAAAGAAGSGGDVIVFNNIAELQTYDVTLHSLLRGQLGYVKTVRDFYLLENAVPGAGSPPLLNNTNTRVVAALNGDSSRGGWWFRLGLCGQQWEDQTNWYIHAANGSDENLGNNDNVPLKTLDELTLRLFACTTLKGTYNVHVQGTSVSVVDCLLGLHLVGENAIVNMLGSGSTSIPGVVFSSSLGVAAGGITGSVSGFFGNIPMASGSAFAGPDSTDRGVLYATWDVGRPTETTQFLGWSLNTLNRKQICTPALTGTTVAAGTAPVTSSIMSAMYSTIQVSDISVEGSCHLNFDKLSLQLPTNGSVEELHLQTAASSMMKFYMSQVCTIGLAGYMGGAPGNGSIHFDGGRFLFDQSRTQTSGNRGAPRKQTNFNPGTRIAFRRSGICAQESPTTVKATSASLEFDDSSLYNIQWTLVDSKMMIGKRLAAGTYSESAATCASTFNLDSDSILDVGGAISPTFNGAIAQASYKINNPDCTILYDSTFTPASGTINVVTSTGTNLTGLTWAQVPVFDMLSAAKVVPGALRWRLLVPTDGGGGGG
jgi:hypothetical protein